MSLTVINHSTIVTPIRTIRDGTLIIEDQRIKSVGAKEEVTPPEGATIIDGQDRLLVPGLFDLQLNGAFGHDFTADPGSIWEVAAALPRFGITTFLPTIVTSPLTVIRRAQATLAAGPPGGFSGAIPLGLHLEGPFLNPVKKGAHNPAYLCAPVLSVIEDWRPETGVRLVTLAPELKGALEVITALAQRRILVAAGHSLANFVEAKSGIMAGIRYATHLFNAMPSVHHRDPGLAGALLSDERVTIGLIPDGIHVHPSLVKLIWQIAGQGRLNLVTDAMAALGAAPGDYLLGDHWVTVGESSATLSDGTLAGSLLSLDRAVRNLVEFTGCDLEHAFRTVTTTPAYLLGCAAHKGQLATGFDADLVLMTREMEPVLTMVAGEIVFSRDGLYL